MHIFIVRVYSRFPEDKRLASGIIENIESGQTEVFHSFDDLQSLLADSIEYSQ